MRNIKKIVSFILSLFLIFSVFLLPITPKAATLTSYVGAVTTQGGNLYVRQSPSTSGHILTALKKGSYVTLLERSGSWWKVEYGQKQYGYCHSDYITPVEGHAVTVDTQGDVLNVRTGPGTSYRRIATLPHGTVVMLRSSENGWSRILYHGTNLGYVSSQYLSHNPPDTSVAYPAIKLNVPSYQQADNRWSSYPLGNYGGTIGSIGCAVTGIAMMESHRTGTTIYPDAMAKKLQFTPGGAVYWPGHYTAVTEKAGYLATIYDLLSQGKPVLLGAKKSSGGQHWIVITGYSGGQTLSPSGFLIHDPGSRTRTNLQQFFQVFPHFYKYFHY